MIDFISSNPNADTQTVACARLLAAVIAQAIEDASNKTTTDTEKHLAVQWLYDEESTFSSYAAIIGVNAEALRKALLAPPGLNEPRNNKFDAMKRRVFRMSYITYTKRKEAEKKMIEELMVKG